MLRLALAILLAPFFRGLLGLPGEQLIFLVSPEAADGTATPLGYLLMALAFSVVYPVFAGFCSALVAGTSAMRLSVGAGIAVPAVGLGVQISYWDTLPVWYHLTLLIPFIMLGGWACGRRGRN